MPENPCLHDAWIQDQTCLTPYITAVSADLRVSRPSLSCSADPAPLRFSAASTKAAARDLTASAVTALPLSVPPSPVRTRPARPVRIKRIVEFGLALDADRDRDAPAVGRMQHVLSVCVIHECCPFPLLSA